MTKISGWPAIERSGSTSTLPLRSTFAPALAPSIRPSGDACTPAAQITVRQATRSTLSPCLIVSISSVMSLTVEPGAHRHT